MEILEGTDWLRCTSEDRAASQADGTGSRQLRAEHQAIVKRADQQHAWELAGDPRGTYGHYAPATI